MNFKVFALYALAFVAYFCVSYGTPRVGDDNMYLTMYYRDVHVPAGAFGTWESVGLVDDPILRSFKMAWWEFKYDTGRFMDFVCGWNLIPYPKIVFSIVTSFVWVLLLHLIWMVAGSQKSWRVFIFAGGYFLLLQNDATLWMGGACAYLWPVTWSLLLVPIFVSNRLGESALIKRNIWMWIVLPVVGFCGGGWHEIIGVPVCFILLTYWIRVIKKQGKLPINGRLILSLFYAVASLIVVFAPSSLARFDRQSESSVSYFVLTKLMSLANTVVCNPLVLLMCIIVIYMLRRPKSRQMLFAQASYWLLMFVMMSAIICFLGEGADRTSWPISVLAFIVILRLITSVQISNRVMRMGRIVCVCFALLTFVYTLYGVINTKHDHENAIEAWLRNPYDLCSIPQNHDSLLSCVFDRSLSARSLVWFGPAVRNMNPSLAAKYNRKHLLGLPARAMDAFGDGEKFCRPERRLANVSGEWYADSDLDIIVGRLDMTQTQYQHGDSCCKKILYKDACPLNWTMIGRMLQDEIGRFSGGVKIFQTSNFYQEFSRDIVYTTLYRNATVSGFVIQTEKGYFVILKHNRYNNRDKIHLITDC